MLHAIGQTTSTCGVLVPPTAVSFNERVVHHRAVLTVATLSLQLAVDAKLNLNK